MKYQTILFATLLLLITSCGNKTEKKSIQIKPIKYATIGFQEDTGTKTFNGTSQSGTETNLSFRANGLIILLDVKNGDRVKKGQLLAKLDQKDISLNYEKTKASVRSAKSQMETTKSNLDRVKELYQSNSASLSDYDQAKNSYENSKSNYETAKKTMNIQASQFEYTKIKAPANGIITSLNADVNEFAQAGSPIFIMNSGGDDLEITVGIPESYISKIKQGDQVSVFINQKKLNGFVSQVAFSTSKSVTYPVIIKIDSPTSDLRPGMPAEVTFSFNIGTKNDVLIVPTKAVGNDENGDFVFQLIKDENENYKCKKKYVELGTLENNGFILKSGIEGGSTVATAGLRTLYDGMLVSLINQ